MLTDRELKRAIKFYNSKPWRVETRVLNPKTKKYSTYEEFFKSEKKAWKHYANQFRLHNPEWAMSLCKFRGIFWMVHESNTAEHHLYRFDEYGIESGVYNLDSIRARVQGATA